MEFNKCSRCGNFFIESSDVCPKCRSKDTLEFETFKNFIKENGITNDINMLSVQTGINTKNLNRFIEYTNLDNTTNNIDL